MLLTPKEKPHKLCVFWKNDCKKHTKFLNDLSFPSKPLILYIFIIFPPKQNKNNAGYNTEAAEAETTTIIFSHYMLDKNWAKHSHFYFPLRKFRTKATVVASRKTESSDMKSLFSSVICQCSSSSSSSGTQSYVGSQSQAKHKSGEGASAEENPKKLIMSKKRLKKSIKLPSTKKGNFFLKI